jgi:Chaperone of endosialidase
MNPLIQRTTILPLLIGLALACFGLCQQVQSATDTPDPGGSLPVSNTADGQNALLSITTGIHNSAFGFDALLLNTDANFNTAVGSVALLLNDGSQNTAVGAGALLSNTTGASNTAVGAFALFNNTIGSNNTANGEMALLSNTAGTFNSAFGQGALASNTGIDNTATGAGALFRNTTGGGNTGAGFQALNDNTTGESNTANGDGALFSNTTGNGNTALGGGAGTGVTTANFVLCLGAFVAGANVNNTTWIANVYGRTTQSGTTAPVVVSDGGQLGTVASSQRFKKDIATMDKASEIILSLRPVTFHYKSDAKGTPQFGLIAEEVAKVNPALVLPDKEGKPYTVRYDAVNAMLLNEFLKEHSKVEQLTKDFQSKLAVQQKQIEALTAGLQKVSAQLEASKPAAQVVKN